MRTPIGRGRKGSFKDTHATDLLAAVLKGVMDQTGVDKALVGDIVCGNVLAPGGFAAQARMAMLLAGFPVEVPINTVNRQCSSGLQAFANVAANIRAGMYDIGIAAGCESMTNNPMGEAMGEINDKVFEHPVAATCLNTMGQTSENVAKKFGISRQTQDQMAVESHAKALKATAAGYFKNEIVPVTTIFTDSKTDEEKTITVTQDDGPRKGTTLEKLGRLRAAFGEGGTTTAGNASQVSDGAAACLVMTRKKAAELGLTPLGTFRSFTVVGVKPEIMGIGPAAAIPPALATAGLKMDDIDVFEINEAFASQATYCVDKLGVPKEKLNPNGGAIALGHPLGCTGARMIATLLHQLKRTKQRYGVVSMCIGTGMGAAAVFEQA